MAKLTLTLSAKDIKIAVKADTYITGQIDKSSDVVKNAALAYNEQAGDDTYHEVKLYRTLRGAVSKFEANMIEYVDPGAADAKLSDTLTQESDMFNIVLPVGSRFLAAFANTLASLAQDYIINVMLYTWWQPIKPSLAKDYLSFSQEALDYVRRGLSKTPPTTSSSYSDVTGVVDEASGSGSTSPANAYVPIRTADGLLSQGSYSTGDLVLATEAETIGSLAIAAGSVYQKVDDGDGWVLYTGS